MFMDSFILYIIILYFKVWNFFTLKLTLFDNNFIIWLSLKKGVLFVKVVIVGGGKVGELLCADFSNIFKEVTIIDTNELRV